MKKTGLQIQDDIFSVIDTSSLKQTIAGKIYKGGMRPINAKTEDAVVTFLTGLNGQIQTGVVNVNIYVPDIAIGSDGQLVCNIPRCRTLEIAILQIAEALKASEYKIYPDNVVQTFPAPEISQHFINARLKFERITF
ncbi:MAG: hypothetical protein NTZ69_16040 [Bacteroidia bacterium]|nr:hypothetical protein [Bacteroidia bacterium]